MLSACIIGVSGYGEIHYRDLMREVAAGRATVLGATVINQVEEAEKCADLKGLGCELFSDYEAMFERLARRIDLCLIPTGLPLHAPMTIAALGVGANVLVEKPAAPTIQEVRAMEAAERAAGRFVAVGYQDIYAAETMQIKERLVSGRLGRIECIKVKADWPRDTVYFTRNAWAGKLKLGDRWVLDSPFNNALAHYVNLACFWAGKTARASAQIASVEAELYRAQPIESCDTACIRAVTADDVPIYFFATHSGTALWGPEILVRCEHGSAYWGRGTAHITFADSKVEELSVDEWETRAAVVGHAVTHIANPDTFICSLDIARAQTICVNGAHESSAIHQLDDALITRYPDGDAVATVIHDIDDIIHRAFDEEKLFSELGVPWAKPGEKVPMTDYGEFKGGKTGA
ncbi:MAG TPA: Gfo/Idh/MocA family oxidoreductase [Candidatus Hydrogenedentes bacterium]|nr:Gfo/Idh/MocA family oxidoreductase [Candidatus Hydrogenedentota bacterium]